MNDDADNHVKELVCKECGRHMIAMGWPTGLKTCAVCTAMPGWFHDPEVAALIDPDKIRRVPKAH